MMKQQPTKKATKKKSAKKKSAKKATKKKATKKKSTKKKSAKKAATKKAEHRDTSGVALEITPYLQQAIRDGHASITESGGKTRINYLAVSHSERFDDPEERVRAEYWSELIYTYGYEPSRIGIEVTVPDRTPRDAADIVIFTDHERTRPYAVIECKKDGISDAEFVQAVEQACGNGTWAKFRAFYVGVVAGNTRQFLDFTEKYGVLEREANIIADVPRSYGKPEEFKYRKNTKFDIAPVNRETLLATIRKCHDTLWGGGELSPPAAFGEMCKIIFVKISDEKKPRKKGESYAFQIKTHEPPHRLASRIKELYEVERKIDPEVFSDPLRVNNERIATLVKHLEGINLSKTDLDTKGVAFERFMGSFFRGDYGQFFTPRTIVQFIVAALDPASDIKVIDPACGSGGFLLYALNHIREKASEYYDDGSPDHRLYWHDFAQKRLFGIEINDEIARVAKMNMILHDDGHSNVVGHDALKLPKVLEERNKGIRPGSFDLVLTNPPFGALVKATESPWLSSFELGNSYDKDGRKRSRKTQKSEVLFLERVWQMHKPGTARAGIVVPDGILTNSRDQYVREWLLENFQFEAIVSLPTEAFFHYGATVKASVIFVRKRAEKEKPSDDEPVLMAQADNIGFDATGRSTMTKVESNSDGNLRIDRLRCDLFDLQVEAERHDGVWIEKRSRVLPGTGIIGKLAEFRKDSKPFFV